MRIVRAGSERIDDLQPLWESLHEHHATIAPHLEELGPVRDPGQSWAVRRELYEEWLEEPDAFVLLAEVGRRADRLRARAPARPRGDLGRPASASACWRRSRCCRASAGAA